MSSYLWVALGGAIGSVARFWCSGMTTRWLGAGFPWGTVLVNVTGCFVIGFFATLTGVDGRWLVSAKFREFFMIGVLGGYTTFSAFSLQTLDLVHAGLWFRAGANVLGSVILCLIAVWAGHVCAAHLNGAR
jgi:fluoride exporter